MVGRSQRHGLWGHLGRFWGGRERHAFCPPGNALQVRLSYDAQSLLCCDGNSYWPSPASVERQTAAFCIGCVAKDELVVRQEASFLDLRIFNSCPGAWL